MFQAFPFTARDGFGCNLLRVEGGENATKGPVLLVHGAGVRGNIFNPPNEKNLVQVLREDGYDVWLENWRGSIECPANEWDLDVVADNDHPAAVEEVCRQTGAQNIKAIIHCQGSTSFALSAIKGLIPQVNMIISNAVSLHPVVPGWSEFKLKAFVPMLKPFIHYLNPHWGDDAPTTFAKLLRGVVKLTHHEHDTTVGKMVSFTYGAGFAALWELSNLNNVTKEWIRGEFGAVPLTFFEHMRKCVKAGALVTKDGETNYVATTPKTTARFVFTAGKLNKCFHAVSQERSFQYLDRIRGNYHKLYEWDSYSHLDIFLGKNAQNDIFPTMMHELNS